MKYHELTTSTNKKSKRVGRGISAGRGKTAGRGTKGQGSRTGSSKRPGFEGGQNPLMQRLPKLRGFTSHRVRPEIVKLSDLENLTVKTVDANVLAEKGLISSAFSSVKVIASGEITRALAVKLPAASAGAIDAIEKAGGTFEPTKRLARPARAGEKKSRQVKKSSAKSAKPAKS